ncbi:hypothetical protein [Streptococcus himalayensis]|nr:hypothetical protein [Streptococcus himalayensis]
MTNEEREFLKQYQEQEFHSFYEVERYALLVQKMGKDTPSAT